MDFEHQKDHGNLDDKYKSVDDKFDLDDTYRNRQDNQHKKHLSSYSNLVNVHQTDRGNLDDESRICSDNFHLDDAYQSSNDNLYGKKQSSYRNMGFTQQISRGNLDDKYKSRNDDVDQNNRYQSSHSNPGYTRQTNHGNLGDRYNSSADNFDLDDTYQNRHVRLYEKRSSSYDKLDYAQPTDHGNLDDKYQNRHVRLYEKHQNSNGNPDYAQQKDHVNLDNKYKSNNDKFDDTYQSSHENIYEKHQSSYGNIGYTQQKTFDDNFVMDDSYQSSHGSLYGKHKCCYDNLHEKHYTSNDNLGEKLKSSRGKLSNKQRNSHGNLDENHEITNGNLDFNHQSNHDDRNDKDIGRHGSLNGKYKSSRCGNLNVQHKHKKTEIIYDYKTIDLHARQAPKSVKNSAEDLVNYLSSVSKGPRMLVRGFFVWISENISYDDDGYFGRASRAPCGAESVMKGGKSVCGGYANVMELLCRQARIPVENISGYAKGYSHSASNPFTLDTQTNHAWNAVQLEGTWYLIDSTWGAGHIDRTNSFKMKFNDFFFLTDPKHFISTHFPYMDDNMEKSMKWQLLSVPISLDEFNENVKYTPEAFKLGVQAVSHRKGYIEMKNELQVTFKSKKEEFVLSTSLMLKKGNTFYEQRNVTFGYPDNGLYMIMIRPPKPGIYRMDVFGKAVSDESHGSPQLMEYAVNCTKVKERDFEYPVSYRSAITEMSVLHEPLRRKLPGNTKVRFRVSAPYLQNVMVGKTFLEKSGTMFSGYVTTCEAGYRISMYGTRNDKYSTMDGLYAFKTVDM